MSTIANSLLRAAREHGAPNTFAPSELNSYYGCAMTSMRIGRVARGVWRDWVNIGEGIQARYDRDRRRFVIREQVTA